MGFFIFIDCLIRLIMLSGLFVAFWKWLKDLPPNRKTIKEAEEKMLPRSC